MRRIIPTLVLLLVLPTLCAARQNDSYLPLSGREMARRFPMRYLGTAYEGAGGSSGERRETRLPERISIGVSGARVEKTDEEGLVITGLDRNGAAWRVRLGRFVETPSSRFYTSDLDGDKTGDLVIYFPTGGNGLAPSSHIYTLTFDPRGRPIPFEADGYFQEDARGIQDLVDLDGDRRAELVYMNFNEGYWVTNLYEAEGGRWRRVKGRHATRSYPLYTRFTNRPNRRPTMPRAWRNPFAPDLSNAAPVLSGTLSSYEWADIQQSEDVKLLVSTVGSEVACSPVSWYGSFGLVTDTPQGREVVTAYGNEARVKELLSQAVRNKTMVIVYGKRRHDSCSPEWVWLTSGL